MKEASNEIGTDIFVVAYNALSRSRQEVVSIPVSSDATYEVFNLKDGIIMDSSLVPSPPKPQYTESAIVSAPFLLYFDTGLLPPVGAVTFRIRMISSQSSLVVPKLLTEKIDCKNSQPHSNAQKQRLNLPQISVFCNEKMKVVFDE